MKTALCIAFLIWASVAHADEWIYSSISDLAAKQIVISSDSIGGHRKAAATTCAESAPYFCYTSDEFNFAFPRNDRKASMWSHNGFVYRVTKTETIGILGTPVDVIEIEQSKKGRKLMKFVYSEKRGVISFHALQARAPVFFLENACGLGAPADCQVKP